MGLLDELKNASASDLEALRTFLGPGNTEPAPEAVSPPPAPAEYWVHLADGRVLETGDSGSTHIDGVLVIGRYPMSDSAREASANE